MVGRKDLIGGASSLGSHSAHVSLPHLLPRLPFFTFLCSALFQSCPSSSLISPHCPQQLGPFPSGSRAVVQGLQEGGGGGVRLCRGPFLMLLGQRGVCWPNNDAFVPSWAGAGWLPDVGWGPSSPRHVLSSSLHLGRDRGTGGERAELTEAP